MALTLTRSARDQATVSAEALAEALPTGAQPRLSLVTDLRILMATIRVVLRGTGY